MIEHPTALEKALIWYARHFPVEKGKLRLIDAVWRLAATKGDTKRQANLIYGGFKAPCDLRFMLQRQYYFFGTFYLERDLLACWSRLAANAKVVFDVGANAGIYSLAAVAANEQASVHAFEPTPEIAERLRETVTLNGIRSLHVHETAVTEHSGKAKLTRDNGGSDNDGMNFIRTVGDDDAEGELVAAVSLDAFCKERGIEQVHLMKIDVQGNEAAALRGAARLLSEGRIGSIFMELNWGAPGDECPASAAVEILDTHGFLFASPDTQPIWRPAGKWMRDINDVMASVPAR